MNTKNLLSAPFAPRHAAQELHDRLLDYFESTRPAPGEAFFTDAELVLQTGLSRSTVRRAIDDLQREGWIVRRQGQGSSVGDAVTSFASKAKMKTSPGINAIRIGILIHSLGDFVHDWYTPMIMDGIEGTSHKLDITVELFGTRNRDANAISERIGQSRPDVLVCLSDSPRDAFVLRDMQKMGIPCIVSGTPHMHLGIPCVREDNRQAAKLAVKHLIQLGHKKIALAIQRPNEPWVFDRLESFYHTWTSSGMNPDDARVHWLPELSDAHSLSDIAADLAAFLQRVGATGVISGSRLPALSLQYLFDKGKLRIPEDLSVVSFEQDVDKRKWFGTSTPDTLRLPLNEMGREIARMAIELANHRPVEMETVLKATLSHGNTCRRLEIVNEE